MPQTLSFLCARVFFQNSFKEKPLIFFLDTNSSDVRKNIKQQFRHKIRVFKGYPNSLVIPAVRKFMQLCSVGYSSQILTTISYPIFQKDKTLRTLQELKINVKFHIHRSRIQKVIIIIKSGTPPSIGGFSLSCSLQN